MAWNGAIQAVFKALFGDANSIVAMITYALVVTLIAVWVTIKVGNMAAKAK